MTQIGWWLAGCAAWGVRRVDALPGARLLGDLDSSAAEVARRSRGATRGTQTPWRTSAAAGANGTGQPGPRPLSRPSPSA